MSFLLKLLILISGLAFVGVILSLVVKRKISERNSLVWLTGALIILILSIVPNILDRIAGLVGVDYPPALLFLFSTLILFLIILYQSIQISVLGAQLKELAQKMALHDVKKEE